MMMPVARWERACRHRIDTRPRQTTIDDAFAGIVLLPQMASAKCVLGIGLGQNCGLDTVSCSQQDTLE